MDYTINRIFIPTGNLITTGDTSALTLQEIGFYNPLTYQALAAYNVDQLLVAFGSGVSQWGSFKAQPLRKAT